MGVTGTVRVLEIVRFFRTLVFIAKHCRTQVLKCWFEWRGMIKQLSIFKVNDIPHKVVSVVCGPNFHAFQMFNAISKLYIV